MSVSILNENDILHDFSLDRIVMDSAPLRNQREFPNSTYLNRDQFRQFILIPSIDKARAPRIAKCITIIAFLDHQCMLSHIIYIKKNNNSEAMSTLHCLAITKFQERQKMILDQTRGHREPTSITNVSTCELLPDFLWIFMQLQLRGNTKFPLLFKYSGLCSLILARFKATLSSYNFACDMLLSFHDGIEVEELCKAKSSVSHVSRHNFRFVETLLISGGSGTEIIALTLLRG
ncbi:unnamed protein product [Dovyalis caffra]|uniref:Uncharacterized protein n=1 Tax=Dovyalis caffra TaxID=77055 RepID=A0AAV1SUC1_9ROSI|nr:unnamed protein product [Dovyalis caffra]